MWHRDSAWTAAAGPAWRAPSPRQHALPQPGVLPKPSPPRPAGRAGAAMGASGWSDGLGNIPSGKSASASVVVCEPGKDWEHPPLPPSSHQDFTANIKSLDIRRISGDRVLKARISPSIFKHFPAESGCREKAEHCRDTNCSFLSLSSVTLKFQT